MGASTTGIRAFSLGLIFVASSSSASTQYLNQLFGLKRAEVEAQAFRARAALEDLTLSDSQAAAALHNADHQLQLIQEVSDQALSTLKFQDIYKGIEVVGSMVFHHESRKDGETALHHTLNAFDLNTAPDLNSEQAVSIAKAYQPNNSLEAIPNLKILPNSDKTSAELVYWVKFQSTLTQSGSDTLVNAHSGKILAIIPHEINIAKAESAKIDVYDATKTPAEDIDQASGSPLRLDLTVLDKVVDQSQNSSSADASALRAKTNSEATLAYYSKHHNRNSYDNKGATLVSVVHVGRGWANAFWSSDLGLMAYGDGDGEILGDLTQGVDVAGHEMTHGVVSEAVVSGEVKGLLYADESGALNEGFADYFGKLIEGKNEWTIGQSIFVTEAGKKNGLRNLATPAALKSSYYNVLTGKLEVRPYPSKLSEKFRTQSFETCDAYNDHCYVHTNATILGHAAYKLNQALGQFQAERLMYTVLTRHLTPTSGFSDFAKGVRSASKLLYSPATVAKVEQVLQEVGL